MNINQISFFPKWIEKKSLTAYLLAMAVVLIVFSDHSTPWYYVLSGVVSVVVFFVVGNRLAFKWDIERIRHTKLFEKKIFWTAFFLRFAWTLLIYTVFQLSYDNPFGFENYDACYYDSMGRDFAAGLRNGYFADVWNYSSKYIDISDLGYSLYLGVIYLLTGDSILAARIIKCFLSAFTVVLMYRLARRNFGEGTARVTAVFCTLWPNFWYYCGAHLKETEMVFLGVLFVEQTDSMLKSRDFSVWKLVPVLMISAFLFTIRKPLALVTVLCLLFSVVMSSSRVVGWGKRFAIGVLALSLAGVTVGNSLIEESGDLLRTVQSGQQKSNMEWRATSANGNAFAKYAGRAVFAPMIFTIPFPSMVRPFDGQNLQQLLNGGNFIKNVLSFFVILSLFMLLFSGKWRDHLVPLSYMLGYLAVLTLSNFAQSERFHQPAMPMEMMFAAYAIHQVIIGRTIVKGIGGRKVYRKWFGIWVVVMFMATIVWNWFKLAGRGLA